MLKSEIRYSKIFSNSFINILNDMANIKVENILGEKESQDEIKSYGVASIISFTGKVKGRFLIDFESNLALKIANNILTENFTDTKERMVLAAISELNNIIAGDANTILNNEKSLGLRLSTPIVLTGKNTVLSSPKIKSESVEGETKYGKFRLNIGFQGEI